MARVARSLLATLLLASPLAAATWLPTAPIAGEGFLTTTWERAPPGYVPPGRCDSRALLTVTQVEADRAFVAVTAPHCSFHVLPLSRTDRFAIWLLQSEFFHGNPSEGWYLPTTGIARSAWGEASGALPDINGNVECAEELLLESPSCKQRHWESRVEYDETYSATLSPSGSGKYAFEYLWTRTETYYRCETVRSCTPQYSRLVLSVEATATFDVLLPGPHL